MSQMLKDDFELELPIVYLPVDMRAIEAMAELLENFNRDAGKSSKVDNVMFAAFDYLPREAFRIMERRLSQIEQYYFNVNTKYFMSALGQYAMEELMFRNFPIVEISSGECICYSREDIVKWYHMHPKFHDILTRPNEEIFLISVKLPTNEIISRDIYPLSKENLVGIAFARMSDVYPTESEKYLTVESNVRFMFGPEISLDDIVSNYLTYRLPLTNKEKIKMPYTVYMNIDNKYEPINFVSLEFMKGIILYTELLDIPDDGHNIIWSNVTLYKDGTIQDIDI
jgi:hypothetical protein